MKTIGVVVLVILGAKMLIGCLGAVETLVPPTSAPNVPTAPTPLTLPPPSPPLPLPSPTSEPVITDPTLVKLIEDAKVDLAARANVSPDTIVVKSAQAVEWSDASLGCPIPGEMYAQVITPGYKIVLEADGNTYNYHTSTTRVMYCAN